MKLHPREAALIEPIFENTVCPNTDTRPLRRADLNFRIVDGETLILDPKAGLIHQLNPTANLVWEHCDGQSSVAEIATHVVESFEVELETAVNDVIETVSRLRELNLLEPVVDGNSVKPS